LRSPRTIAAAEPAAFKLNMLLVDLMPNPEVQIIFDPVVAGSGPVTVRIYRTIDRLAFTPSDSKSVLYVPYVTAGGTPMGMPPQFQRIEIETAIDPDFPLNNEYYRTISLNTGGAVPDNFIRHRLPLPGTGTTQLPGETLITHSEVDDSFVFLGGKKALYTIRASNATVEFDFRWKRIRSGVDPGNPRDFFLQVV